MAIRSPQILVVDDDPHIRELLSYALQAEHFSVLEAQNGQEGLECALLNQPDVIILDVMMPEMDGLDMCRELRKTSQIPVLFLSSRDSELDRVIGLELGGDDYVAKPFSPREVLARVKAMIRRKNTISIDERLPESQLQQGLIQLNYCNFQVQWQNIPIVLTITEFSLLRIFMESPQRVFTRDALAQSDMFRDIVSERTIDSHIRRLRQKFSGIGCQNVVDTVHGFGYKLGSCL